MSSVRDNRQRAAARARLEREMKNRRAQAARRRKTQARVAGIAAGVVVLGAVVWIIVAATGGGNKNNNTASGPTSCTYTSDYPTPSATPSPTPGASGTATATVSASPTAAASPDPSAMPTEVHDVGRPPADPPRSGFQVFTFETNLGTIKVEADLSKVPCTANSIAFLAGKGFYDNAPCHRLVADIYVLQCGDPSGTGYGGSNYHFGDENLPTGKLPAYHDGDVAMANTGQPGTNGSQFFFVYGVGSLPGQYTLWGKVIEGMDIIKKVAAAGDDEAYAAQSGGGKPLLPITFTKVTASAVSPTSAYTPQPTTEAASPSASASASPSASASS